MTYCNDGDTVYSRIYRDEADLEVPRYAKFKVLCAAGHMARVEDDTGKSWWAAVDSLTSEQEVAADAARRLGAGS